MHNPNRAEREGIGKWLDDRDIIPSLTLLKIKNAHKERGCALCEHFLFGFNVCYIFFTVILIFLSSLSLLA